MSVSDRDAEPASWSGESAEFDEYAERYDAGLDNPVKRMMGSSADQFIAVKARWLLRHEPNLRSPDASGLDYGCGVGSMMRVLAGLGTRAAFTGCDISAGMLSQAAQRWPSELGPPPALVPQHGPATPFPADSFDFIVISAVLHHVPLAERGAVFAELGRVVKPGGHVYVFEHNPRNPLVRFVVARTPIDRNAILLDAREVRHGLQRAIACEMKTEYLMFTPPGMAGLQALDRSLGWLPLGAQYVVAARKQ